MYACIQEGIPMNHAVLLRVVDSDNRDHMYRVLHFGYQTHCFADDTKRTIQGLHDLINFSGAGGSVEYTHNGVSIGWHIAKKPGLKTFVVQRAELQRANDKNILQTR
jgi:hypothetical protein